MARTKKYDINKLDLDNLPVRDKFGADKFWVHVLAASMRVSTTF